MSLLSILTLAFPNSALALKYQVAGWDMTPSNLSSPSPWQYYWTGTRTSNYVMSSPTITWMHVNSIYVIQENNNYPYDDLYEFGWLWPAGGRPRWFVARIWQGVYTRVVLDYATPNTNHSYSISIDSAESPPKVRYRLDGNLVYTDNSAKFPTGYSVWGSERQNLDETNYGHFWNLKKRRHDWSWWPWENHEQWRDDDPGYKWYWMNESEGKSIKG
jgi:hypothetical protein